MKIDIDDINYLYSHEEIHPDVFKEKYSGNILILLKNWIKVICKEFYYICFFYHCKRLLPCDYLFIAPTGNNYRSLKPLQEKMDNAEIYTSRDLPNYRIWFYALVFSPIVFLKYIKHSGFLKKSYARGFSAYCSAYGYSIEAKRIIRKINPKMLIVANDHSHIPRAFFRCAQSLNIKVIYTQHASVTEDFPPLEFDYAFLDGQESLEKYMANGKICKSKIFLLGNPRFDIITTFVPKTMEKDSLKIRRLGIALGENDIQEKFDTLIYILKEKISNLHIEIRPHPAMKQSFWQKYALKNGLSFSNSKIENPFQFIAKNDIFISGESSFHLDVALSGKNSYFYNLTDYETIDHYGYLKSGLIKDLSKNVDEINNEFDCSSSERQKLLQYYVANYNTNEWGKAAEIIAITLQNIE